MVSAIIDSAGIVECLEAGVESIWELIQECGDQTDRWVSKEGLKLAAFEDKSFEYIIAKHNGRWNSISILLALNMCIDEIVTLKSHMFTDGDVVTLLLKKAMEILLKRNCHTLCLILLESDLSKFTKLGGEVEVGFRILRISLLKKNLNSIRIIL